MKPMNVKFVHFSLTMRAFCWIWPWVEILNWVIGMFVAAVMEWRPVWTSRWLHFHANSTENDVRVKGFHADFVEKKQIIRQWNGRTMPDWWEMRLVAGLRTLSDLTQYWAINGDILQAASSSNKNGFIVKPECFFFFNLQFLGSAGPLYCSSDLEEAQHQV